MNYEESSAKIRQLLAKSSDTKADDWHLCLKARFGMAIVFRAIRDEFGDGHVLTMPYTCITAINPILVSGLTPIYSDIDEKILSLNNPDEKLLKKGTHAMVMQHTLGMIGNKENLRKFADKHNLLLIEDAAHSVTRFARDKKGEILADISAHSFGVEKILTGTKFGGAIWINPALKDRYPTLYERIIKKLDELPKPNKALAFRIRNYKISNGILQRTHGNLKNKLRNLEIKTKLLEPAVYPFEQEARQADPCTTNNYINRRIILQLENLKSNYIRRDANVDLYEKKLKSKHFSKLSDLKEPLLAFPIVFEKEKKAQEAYEMLSAHGYFIRRWYTPLIYPGPKSLKMYRYSPKMAPKAEEISKKILCLPTDLPVIETKKIIELLTD